MTTESHSKLPYEAPSLVRFGKISELTAGGSTGATEYSYATMMDMNNPGFDCYTVMISTNMNLQNSDPGPPPSAPNMC